MKTLYESILDDEDILICRTKESVNNWLLVLKELMIADTPEKDILEFLNNSKPIKNIIKDYLSKQKLKTCLEKYGYEYQKPYDENSSVVRFCTSWATKEENVRMLLEDMK